MYANMHDNLRMYVCKLHAASSLIKASLSLSFFCSLSGSLCDTLPLKKFIHGTGTARLKYMLLSFCNATFY